MASHVPNDGLPVFHTPAAAPAFTQTAPGVFTLTGLNRKTTTITRLPCLPGAPARVTMTTGHRVPRAVRQKRSQQDNKTIITATLGTLTLRIIMIS